MTPPRTATDPNAYDPMDEEPTCEGCGEYATNCCCDKLNASLLAKGERYDKSQHEGPTPGGL